jgi:protein-disulfide isomerase
VVKAHGFFRSATDIVSLLVVGGALALLGGRTLYSVLAGGDGSGNGVLAPARFVPLLATGQWTGPKTAPVAILLYNDYTCGFCAELHGTLEVLKRRYPQHLAVVTKHFVEPNRLQHYKIPQAVECAADQGRFAEYHAAAFANGHLLNYTAGWRLLADSAKVPGLSAFETCVQAGHHVAKIADQYREARELGVTLTPTLLVNGTVVQGAAPLEVLDSLVAMNFRERGPQRGK